MNTEIYKKPGLFFCVSTLLPWTLWSVAALISHIEWGTSILDNKSSIDDITSSLLSFLGLMAPLGVTLYLMKGNKDLTEDMKGRLFNFRDIKTKYRLFVCFFMLASILLAQAVSLLFGYSADQFRLADSFSFTSGVFPVWVMLIIAPLLEELAWHSYGTDALRSRYNLFFTSIIFALFWGLWHLPLSFIKDYYHSNLVQEGVIYSVNFLVSLFPFVFILNWLYYKTGRNILLPVIFHISAGYFNEIFATHPMSKVIQTGLLSLFVMYILVKDKRLFFTKKMVTGTSCKSFNSPKLIRVFTIIVIAVTVFSPGLYSQSVNQTIRGRVYDNITQEPLPFSSITVLDSDPLTGTIAGPEGDFIIENVAVGRINIRVDMLGYESYIINELLVSSGRELVLDVAMKQGNTQLNEVVVRVSKESPLNSMTWLSARQFTVEETQRYAGGIDDPARLVTSFAGVVSPSVSSSGISVRGNNPAGLLWRIEGVEVPNPSHFADLTIAGGGMMTAISSQMMGNSDFLSGAFPAEYGNASAGIFDIRLNPGNSAKQQYTIQAGLLGMDLATQGPLVKGKEATYNLNYRYSTMGLIAPVLPDDAGVLKYQDFCFKTNFPTRKSGTFSFWGIGALDGVEMQAVDSIDWKWSVDRDNAQTSLNMFASGLTHKINLNSSTFLSSTLSASGNGLSHREQRLDFCMEANPQSKAENFLYRVAFQSFLNKRFGSRHCNKTGFGYQYLGYNMDVSESQTEGMAPAQLVSQKGNSGLLQIYSQSKIDLFPRLRLNVGLNAQYLVLNNNLSVEPRMGLQFDLNSHSHVALAYGRHSRMEQLPVYFVESAGRQPNKELKFMRSEHYVFSYATRLSHDLRFNVELYYQNLSNVPVAPSGYISILNYDNALFFNEILCSKGKGRNVGVDITLERFMNEGFYWLLTASLFDSKYTGADGVERNTRYNRNYAVNVVAGKEWTIGKNRNKSLGVNVRYNHLGGNRVEPVDQSLSLQNASVEYGETNGNLAFDRKFADNPILSFTISYRKNKPGFASVWSLQILNATKTQEFRSNHYNYRTHQIDAKYEGIMIPNVSYKIEF